jgi:hypothetical protein
MLAERHGNDRSNYKKKGGGGGGSGFRWIADCLFTTSLLPLYSFYLEILPAGVGGKTLGDQTEAASSSSFFFLKVTPVIYITLNKH